MTTESGLAAAAAGGRRARISYAPQILDIFGGSALHAGTLFCAQTLNCGAAVAIAPREQAELRVREFDVLERQDEKTLPFPSLATVGVETTVGSSAQMIAVSLRVLHDANLIDLNDPHLPGLDVAIRSNIAPTDASARSMATCLATLINLRDQLGVADKIDPMRLAELCAGALRMASTTSDLPSILACSSGIEGAILKLLAQPLDAQGFITLPQGIAIVGLDTGLRATETFPLLRTRLAAAAGYHLILEKMHAMGRAAGMRLVADPMRGYLANLDLDDYKRFFRQFLPESMMGSEIISRIAGFEAADQIEPDTVYAVQSATDHCVHEPKRAANFAAFIEQAAALPPHTPQRSMVLDKAGHLMYASHISTTRDAGLGTPEMDCIVDQVRKNERAGLYGARSSGCGLGKRVAILANDDDNAMSAIARIADEYRGTTGRSPLILRGSSPGALQAGTQVIDL